MLTQLGITYPQYLVLMVLWEKDSQPVNDIAHRLLLETNTVTPLLQRMERQGLLCRKQGEQDKRQQLVSLTEQGKALKEQAFATREAKNCIPWVPAKNKGQDVRCHFCMPVLFRYK